MNHCFVVCDAQAAFAEKMARYVNKNHLSPYMMESFTEKSLLIEYGKSHYIDVLLIDEAGYAEAVSKLDVGKVYLLVEDRAKQVEDGITRIYKYSSIPEIMKVVMCDYADRDPNAISTLNNNVRVIGTFSPAPGYRHPSFVLTMAMILAEKSSVLYINACCIYGYRILLKNMSELDLSDVMYEIQNGRENMKDWSAGLISEYGNLHYILPAISATDLQSAETKDWMMLIDALIREGGYDFIILDIDESINACFEVLMRCDVIYSFHDTGILCDAAYKAFASAAEKMGFADIFRKMRRVKVPEYEEIEDEDQFLNHLKNGKTGAYVRELLAGKI